MSQRRVGMKVKRYGRGIPTTKKPSAIQGYAYMLMLALFIFATIRQHMIT